MSRLRAIAGGLLLAAMQACTSLGPDSLSERRPAYNEAIAATNAEQYLAWFVRMRYGLPSSHLAVSSITANVRFRTNAEVQFGFGPTDNYTGNLVPFSGGVVYDENPTISYVPVQGEEHFRSLLSPLPMDLLGLLLNMSFHPETVFAVLVRRVNGVPNPDFITDRDQETDSRFAELLTLMSLLGVADKLTFFQSSDNPIRYSVWIHDYTPQHAGSVGRLLELLRIEGIEPDGRDIVLPVVGALKRPVNRSIAIQTRSALDIARIASASVEVPAADHDAGLTIEFPKAGIPGEYIRVQRAASRPANAAATTRFRDWWYYIAGDDTRSKLYFVLISTLMTMQLSDAAAEARAPVLTVPVN